MNTEATATRLAIKLLALTVSGKLVWTGPENTGAWGEGPGQTYKAKIEEALVQVAEVPLKRSTMVSYYFGLLEGEREVFEVFAEGIPTDPTPEQRALWHALKDLFYAARDSARGTKQKVEQFEQLLEKLA
jgi:hypothetical protein